MIKGYRPQCTRKDPNKPSVIFHRGRWQVRVYTTDGFKFAHRDNQIEAFTIAQQFAAGDYTESGL